MRLGFGAYIVRFSSTFNIDHRIDMNMPGHRLLHAGLSLKMVHRPRPRGSTRRVITLAVMDSLVQVLSDAFSRGYLGTSLTASPGASTAPQPVQGFRRAQTGSVGSGTIRGDPTGEA